MVEVNTLGFESNAEQTKPQISGALRWQWSVRLVYKQQPVVIRTCPTSKMFQALATVVCNPCQGIFLTGGFKPFKNSLNNTICPLTVEETMWSNSRCIFFRHPDCRADLPRQRQICHSGARGGCTWRGPHGHRDPQLHHQGARLDVFKICFLFQFETRWLDHSLVYTPDRMCMIKWSTWVHWVKLRQLQYREMLTSAWQKQKEMLASG